MSSRQNHIILFIMMMTALGQGAVALCVPSLPAIAHDLIVSTRLTKDLIGLFFLGFGVSQLFYGPFSDRYGRKPVIIVGLIIFCISSLLAVFSHSIHTLLLLRFIQGFGAGSLMVSSRAILRDTHDGAGFTRVASYLSIAFALGMGSMPLMASYIQQYFGWRATFILLFGAGFIMLLLTLFYKETIRHKNQSQTLAIYLAKSSKNYLNIMANLRFLRYLVGGTAAYSVVICYNIMTPFLIQKHLHFSPSFFGWMTVIISVAYFIGAYSNRNWVNKVGVQRMIESGIVCILIAGVCTVISVRFMPLNIYILMIPLGAATIGQTFIFSNYIAGALQDFAHSAGMAAALYSSLQITLAGFISSLLSTIHEKNQLQIGYVLVVIAIVIIFTLGKNNAKHENNARKSS